MSVKLNESKNFIIYFVKNKYENFKLFRKLILRTTNFKL